jgi:hypothetical protein
MDRTKIREYYDLVKAKAVVVREPEKTFYGTTEFSIEDNNRYLLPFAENEKA